MGTVVSGTHTTGITLSSTPTTLAGTITLTGSGIGMYGSVAGTAWDVINIGAIAGTATGDIGIEIDGAGTVTNGTATGSSAAIITTSYGVELGTTGTASAGLVVNYGSIITTGIAFGAIDLNGGGRVVNEAGGLISGRPLYYGIYTGTRASTVTNAGTVAGGVFLVQGGIVNNAASGTITGYDGVYAAFFAAASVFNAGLIEGSIGLYSAGVDLDQGGTLLNSAGGTIGGTNGIYIGSLAGFVTNSGIVIGTGGSGLVLSQGGQLSNTSTGRITGTQAGVVLQYNLGPSGGATVVNAGYIGGGIGVQFATFTGAETVINLGTIASTAGASGEAIGFTNSADRLVVDTGADFIGTVVGAGIIELGPGSGDGTLFGLGYTITGFSTVAFDAGGTWLVGGNSAGFEGSITGFSQADTLDLSGISATTAIFAANMLTLEGGSGAVVDSMNLAGDFSSSQFSLQPDQSGGTMISLLAPCFVQGTRIATPSGDVAVENLAIGDHVLLLSGDSKPIKWIGRRSYHGRFVGANPDILPIIIRPGALADGVPRRELLVSPKHAMFFHGLLIPAEKLVDGVAIQRCPPIDSLTYIHLEFDGHEVIFAEGAATESFVDCDSRAMFQNAHEFAALYPGGGAPRWEFCAPRIEGGEALARVRRSLAARAARLRAAQPGSSLDGRVDTVSAACVTGWAFDATQPHTPVLLEILDHDRVIGECAADRYRPDLASAGIGSGHCSFIFPLRGSSAARLIRARRKSDGAEIPSAPVRWQRPECRPA